MKLIQKLTAICCVTLLSISVMTTANPQAAQPLANEASFLAELGIVAGYDSNSQSVSKQQFIESVLKLKNYTPMSKEDLLDYAAQNDLLASVNATYAKPEDSITYIEALYALVHVLGYKYKAMVSGGYPNGYMPAADEAGISRGVAAQLNERLNGAAVIRLLYNTIRAPYVKMASITSDSINYALQSNYTILSEFHDIYYATGNVLATEISGLYSSEGAVGKNKIKIDSVIYDCPGKLDYLGYYVEFFYVRKENKITSILPHRRNQRMLLESKNVSAQPGKIIYDVDQARPREVGLTKDVAVIYNGVAHPGYTVNDFIAPNSMIELIDNNGNGYNIAKIWDYQLCWVRDVDIDTQLVFNTFGGAFDMSTLLNNTVDVVDTLGNPKYLIDIKPTNVLSIAQSLNSAYTRIIISEGVVEGEITERYENLEGSPSIIVNGESYEISESYENMNHSAKHDLLVGFSGKFFLNSFGEVYGATKRMSDSANVGYLTAIHFDATSISNRVSARIFTTENEMKEYAFAQKVRFDDQSPVSGQGICDMFLDTNNEFAEDAIKRQLIVYTLNSDGEINTVDLAYSTPELTSGTPFVPNPLKPGESENSLKVDYNYSIIGVPDGRLAYRSRIMTFGGKVVMTSATKVFAVSPKDLESDDEDYEVGTTSMFSDNTSTNYIEAYSTTIDNLTSEYVVKYPVDGSDDSAASYDLVLVGTLSESMGENGNTFTKMQGINTDDSRTNNISSYTFKSDVDTTGLVEGSYIRAHLDFKGLVKKYDVIDIKPLTGSWFTRDRLAMFTVLENNNGVLKCVPGVDPYSNAAYELINANAFRTISVFNGEKPVNKIRIGSEKDVKSYADFGEDCTRLILIAYYAEDRGLVLYNKKAADWKEEQGSEH